MRRSLSIILAALLLPTIAPAQTRDLSALAERFVRMTAVTGFEQAALDTVQRLMRGSQRDRAGNVVLDRGAGPSTLVVCPFDEVGYVVGGIREDGWLTLRRVGARAPSPLFDQYHEGQRVTVFGRKGALSAVIGVRSTHLQRGRSQGDAPFTVDDALVDIGAANAAQVRTAGVELLAPVAMQKTVTRYGAGLLAGPSAGRRSACAALAQVAALATTSGHFVLAFAVEQELGQRGLRTLANARGPFERTIILDGANGAAGTLLERSDTVTARALPTLGAVTRLSVPTRNSATPVETVSIADFNALRDRLIAVMGGAK